MPGGILQKRHKRKTKAVVFSAAAVLLIAIALFSLNALGILHFGKQLDQKKDAGGYWTSSPVSGKAKYERSEKTRMDMSSDAISLGDGTQARICSLTSGTSVELTLEKMTNTITPEAFDLETTGSMRVLKISGIDISSSDPGQLISTGVLITIPKAEKGGIDGDTINMMRVGSVIENGKILPESIKFLPVSVDADGNITATDIYFADSLFHFAQLSRLSGNPGQASGSRTIEWSMIDGQTVAGSGAANAFSSANSGPIEIKYCLVSFQGSINWNRQPALIRMVPNGEASDKRTPIGGTSGKIQQEELKKPVQNVIVFVHGRNEAEKGGGAETAQIGTPWFYAYKRDVWTHLYDAFIKNHEDLLNCTVFYEFVYPTFRPILSPVAGQTDKVTVDRDFERLLREALKDQLDNDLEFNLMIVAHSMGGIVARGGVQHFDQEMDACFRNLLTWGTPHHGSPLVTLRYALGSLGTAYQFNSSVNRGLQSIDQGSLYLLFRQAIESFSIDTPGTRDLRWDNGFGNSEVALQIADYFSLTDRIAGSDAAKDWYDLASGGYLFSESLHLLNTRDNYRDQDKYIFLYGLTSKHILAEKSITLPIGIDGHEITYHTVNADEFGEIAIGASVMPYLIDSPEKLFSGKPRGASDGAVPVSSMMGELLAGQTVNLGDTDHEEYFGAPAGTQGFPGAFTNPGAALETAAKTYQALGIGVNPDYGCPETKITTSQMTLRAVRQETGEINLAEADHFVIEGILQWPGDHDPGSRIKMAEGMLIEVSGRMIPAESYTIEADGSFALAIKPHDFYAGTINSNYNGSTERMVLRLTFKDNTELASQETRVDIRTSIMSLRIDPEIAVIERGTEIIFDALVENYDGDAVFAWDFGDGKSETSAGPAASVQHVYEVEGRFTVKVLLKNAQGKILSQAKADVVVKDADETTTSGIKPGEPVTFPQDFYFPEPNYYRLGQLVALGDHDLLLQRLFGWQDPVDYSKLLKVDQGRQVYYQNANWQRFGWEAFYSAGEPRILEKKEYNLEDNEWITVKYREVDGGYDYETIRWLDIRDDSYRITISFYTNETPYRIQQIDYSGDAGLNGIKVAYWPNGQVHVFQHVADGKGRHGPFKEYYESGALHIEGSYKNNVWDGHIRTYNPDGTLSSDIEYANGKPVNP